LEVNDKRPGDLDHLLGPYSVDNLDVHQVSTLVNSPANDRAECIESVKEQS
jgi:putative SOS response-associated peptidase YedK